jgi:two-component system, LytTR family, sensor kinase
MISLSMDSPRYFGIVHLWSFCLVICLMVNLPQLITFVWNPGFFDSVGGYSVPALVVDLLDTFLFSLLFALLYVGYSHPILVWYQSQPSFSQWSLQFLLLLILTSLFFWIQLLIAGPTQEVRFFYVTHLIRNTVIVVAIWGFWHYIDIVQKSNQVAIENEQLKRLKVKNQLEALSNQLNPHFLFNALNILNVSITTDPEGAQAIVHNLSDILRYNLKIQNQNLVRLSEELQVAESYLELYKARFGDKLVFVFENTAPKKTWYVVPLSLQILIENAIKHNIITSNSILRIRVYVHEEIGQLVITNTINKKVQTESLGIGLSNLEKRYQLITGLDTSSSEDTQHFTVTIPLIESP